MPESRQPLIVIGHKNPDTDSVCSAIAYARLKNDFLETEAVPFRAGNINLQTNFVLSHFGVVVPEILTDVYPKIADIMIQDRELIILGEEDTLGHALDIMIENCFSFLPVIDAENKYAGKITALRLAGLTREFADLSSGKIITFDFEKFVASVGGRVIGGSQVPVRFTGKLKIKGISGDQDLKESGPVLFITPCDEDAVVRAVEEGVGIIVVCRRESLGRRLSGLAKEHGLVIVSSPRDIFDISVSIVLAMPLKDLIDGQHQTFKHYDLVRNVKREIGKYNEGGFIVVDDDGFIKGVITRISFLNQSRFRVAMVDHNEFSQGVDGLEEAEVVEIIDHHRLGARNTDVPINFINKVVGSTATIIAELYRNFGFTPDPGTAGLMLSAILADTIILKSPTTTHLDEEMVKSLAARAGVEVEEFGEDMFAAGSALEGVDPEQIIKQDQKMYIEGELKFSISQVEVVGFKKFYEMKNILAEKLTMLMDREGCSFSCLMVTDISKETSLLLCTGEKRRLEAITYPRVEENIFEMKDVLSRKKQVLPYLLDLIRRS